MLRSDNKLADLYKAQNRHKEAEALYLKTVEIGKRVLGEEHSDVLHHMHDLAVLYMDQNQSQQAEPLLLSGYELRRRVFGERHPATEHILRDLLALYEAWDKPEKWRAKLPRTAAVKE